MDLPETNVVNNINQLIDFCYSRQALNEPLNNTKELCEQITRSLLGDEKIYIGIDTVIREGQAEILSVHINDTCIEQIHSLTPAGMPPYQLKV